MEPGWTAALIIVAAAAVTALVLSALAYVDRAQTEQESATPTENPDALLVNDELLEGFGISYMVVTAASTGVVNLTDAVDSLDQVSVGPGQYVLLLEQAAASENGLYEVGENNLLRPVSKDRQFNGMHIYVHEGSVHARKTFIIEVASPEAVRAGLATENAQVFVSTVEREGNMFEFTAETPDDAVGVPGDRFVSRQGLFYGRKRNDDTWQSLEPLRAAQVTIDTAGSTLTGTTVNDTIVNLDGHVRRELGNLAPIAFSGEYEDLNNAATADDIVFTTTSGISSTRMGPAIDEVNAKVLGLAAVATTGDYQDLTGLPTAGDVAFSSETGIVAANVAAGLDAVNASLSTVAKTGVFSDLTGLPSAADVPYAPADANFVAPQVAAGLDSLQTRELELRATLGTSTGTSALPALGTSLIRNDATVVEAFQDLATNVAAIPTGFLLQGNWDAANNVPDLTLAGNQVVGHFYKVAANGTTDLNGVTAWNVGDSVYYGTNAEWNKIDNTESVTTVFGRVGSVVPQAGDYTAADVSFAPPVGLTASTVQGALVETRGLFSAVAISNDYDDLSNKPNAGALFRADDTTTVESSVAALETVVTQVGVFDSDLVSNNAPLAATFQDVHTALQALYANSGPSLTLPEVQTIKPREVTLNWAPPTHLYALTQYALKYRPVDSEDPWLTTSPISPLTPTTSGTVADLDSSTVYDIVVESTDANARTWVVSPSVTVQTLPLVPFVGGATYQYFNLAGATEGHVVVMEDNCEIAINGETVAGGPYFTSQLLTLALKDSDIVSSDQKFFLGGTKNASTVPMTTAEHLITDGVALCSANRGSPHLLRVYTYRDSVVTVLQGANTLATAQATGFLPVDLSVNASGSFEIVVEEGDFLAYKESTNVQDPYVVLPRQNEWLGWASNSLLLAFGRDAGTYTSETGDETFVLSAVAATEFELVTLPATGSQFAGPATWMSTSVLTHASSSADSNGSCAASFQPIAFGKTTFGLPVDCDWVAFASDAPFTVSLSDASETVLAADVPSQGTSTRVSYLRFVSDILAGATFRVTTGSAVAWYQPANTDDETVLSGTA